MTRVVYNQVVNVTSTLQEAAKWQCRFCKSKNSKSVEDSASKFVGLEKSLTCQKCTRKFATVKSRRIHESRYCGREKAENLAFSPAMSTIEMEWSSKM